MRKLIKGWLLLVWLVAGLASAEIRLTDDLGREVVLAKPAQRIISLAPHITEVVYAAGAGDQLVGVVTYSDYPEAAGDLPLVGNYKQINYEAVLSLNPDLILAWGSGNGDQIIQRLETLGLTVFVAEPRTMEDVPKTLRSYGILSGHRDVGEREADRFVAEMTALQQRYSSLEALTVFYQVWNDPLVTINGKHLISDVIRLCGGRNVFGDAVPLAPRVSVESIISADPQVIVASGMDKARPEWLDEWYDWPVLQAVQNDYLFFVEPDILQRHTPRILEGARQMCAHLESARASLRK